MNIRTLWSVILTLSLAAAASGADLTVTVAGLKETGGILSVSLFNTEASWNEDGTMGVRQRLDVDEKTEVVVFDDLVPGTYAIRLMHDENGNGKLDTNWLGIPNEGWGFSNNPRTRGPAKWSQAAFELGDENMEITIKVQ